MSAKKKGPGKGRGPATRPASPAKRTTIPKSAAPKPPAAGTTSGAGKPSPAPPNPAAATPPSAGTKAAGGTPSATPAKAPGGPKAAAPGHPAAVPKSVPAKSAAAKGAGAAKSAAVAKSGGISKAGATSKQAAPGKGGTTRTTPTREERLAAAEAARRRQRIRNKALLAGGVALVIFVVGFVITSDRKERSRQAAQFTTASCTFDRTSDSDDGAGRNHTPPASYRVNPPAGGNHTPQAAPPGIYTDANVPIDAQIVHAMEHGYVVLWYRSDLDEPTLAQLRELAQKHARDVLMVPRPSLPVPVAATVWHARVLCGGLEVDTFEKFIDTFVNKGPEKVPH